MKKEARKRLDRMPIGSNNKHIDASEIKRLRLAKGLSIREAAKRGDSMSYTHWYNVESGKIPDPRISMVYRIAKVLGVKPTRLLKHR